MSEDLPTLYEEIGGEEVLRKMVDLFYDEMDQNAEMLTIREMHAQSLRLSRDKLFMFLSGWTGGPNLYVEHYGHPRLRARHMPFAIGDEEAAQWIACMEVATTATVNETVKHQLMSAFRHLAGHMRNQSSER